jgi:digeranylgeranylglycerophospholipid reductase
MTIPHYDLIIIGAGPAGMSCARHYQAVKPDSSVAVIERLDDRKHGIYHRMCGEGISQKGWSECPDAEQGMILNRINRAVELYPEDVRVETRIKGVIIDRSAWLRRMQERFISSGGVLIRDTFQNAERRRSWNVATKDGGIFEAGLLIGADGSNSAVRGKIFPSLRPEVIWAEQFLLDEEVETDVITFQYAERYSGTYRWTFPMRGQKKIGFPLGADSRPESYLERHARGIAIGDLKGFALEDAALVGDAAAQVNPITFGGIRTAVAAGRMAAEAAAAGDMRQYEKAWSRSPFSPAGFMPAYLDLKEMDDATTAAMARPMAGSMAALKCAKAAVSHPEWARAYRAFMQAMRYGW